jgi:hypothetical protein
MLVTPAANPHLCCVVCPLPLSLPTFPTANPVLVQGGDTVRVFEEELGGPPEQLLRELRYVWLHQGS